MKTRVTPSLETLGERLNLSPVIPTTEQTRQVSIVVDLAPPDLNPSVSTREAAVPSVTDLVLDRFDGRAAGAVTGRFTGVAVDPSDPSSEGHECLVFFLGGIPSAEGAVRHRGFAIVDRTQMTADGVAILSASLPGGEAEETRRRSLVATHSFDLDQPGTAPAAPDGRHFKPLFAPLVLELDTATAAVGESGPSVLLQRLANPSIPDAAGGDARPGTGVYKSIDGGLWW